MYDLTDGEDMAVKDMETLNDIEEAGHDADKPSNVQKRPAGQNTRLERRMAIPPKTPATMPVSRFSMTQIINGEIVIVPRNRGFKVGAWALVSETWVIMARRNVMDVGNC